MWYLAQAEEEHNPILPLWQEVVVGAIAFALLCWLLMKYVFPRMEQTFQARVNEIEGGIERAKVVQAEANQLLEQYRTQLAGAKTEAAMIRDDARADAEGIRQEVLAQARQEADRVIAAGRDTFAAERATLVRDLRGELGALSIELASRLVGESLADEARRAGTVDRFLAELEQRDADPAAAGAR